MQGRLSPSIDGRIQAFPANTWRDEFARAQEAGLHCIEWIYDVDDPGTSNPIGMDSGVSEILELVQRHGVAVMSICADYFMKKQLVGGDGTIKSSASAHLKWLIGRASLLGARHIVLPFVDSSSVKCDAQLDSVVAVMRDVIAGVEGLDVEIHLETDLAPARFKYLLERIGCALVRANYDIGNSASLGYSPAEELTALRTWLGSVHVNDRILAGGTVPLGRGAADFETCFRLIGEAGFRGPFILQAARENGLSETELAIKNRKFVTQLTRE